MTTYKVKQTENGITFKRDRRLEYRISKFKSGCYTGMYAAECCFTRTGCMCFPYGPGEFADMIDKAVNYLKAIVYSGEVEFVGLENVKPF